MIGRRARLLGNTGAVALGVMLTTGCYTYTPVATLSPPPSAELSLVLTDQGRASAGVVLGPGLERVDGQVVQATDSSYLLRVARVTNLQGVQTAWRGETVTVARAWVGSTYERRFSRSRTYLIAGVSTALLTAFIASHGFGLGGPILQNPTGGSGGNSQ
jgi:hypothetical protein